MRRQYESNGPDHVRIKGTAIYIRDEYIRLGKETQDNPVLSEQYYQYAEHYERMCARENFGSSY